MEEAASINQAFTTTSFFPVISQTLSFVDKSLMIQAVINESENMLITGPRRFGKSSNLDMLRRFFDMIQDNDRSIFNNLKISRYPDTMEKHCGKYAVLWIDMSKFGSPINSFDSAITAIREILHNTYRQYDILCSVSLKHGGQNICKRWCDDELFENMSVSLVGMGFQNLAYFLHEHYKKDIVILIDEFDSICNRSMYNVSAKVLNEIIKFYHNMFAGLVKTEKSEPLPFVFKAIFTGVTAVTCTGPSPLNNLRKYPFLQKQEFADYYGILVEEFDTLLQKPQFTGLSNQRDDLLTFFNGYELVEREILCTYSIVQYLKDYLTTPHLPFDSYWCNSGALDGFENVWQREEMQPLLRNIVNDQSVRVEVFKNILPENLRTLALIFACADTMVLSDIDIFLVYLQQLGYFKIVSSDNDKLELRIPNEEIRTEFKTILSTCFETKYKFSDVILEKCANELDRLVLISNENGIKQIFDQFKVELEKACREYLVREFLNEATLEHLIFAVLLKSVFRPISQTRVENASDNRTVNKLDLCFYRKNIGIVAEVKFGRRESTQSALAQIKEKKYYDVFSGRNIPNIEKRFCVGIHLNRTGKLLSLDYECM